MAVWLCVEGVGDDMLQPTTLAAVPFVLLVSKVIGLYERDELTLEKSTLEEVPALFQLATLYSLVFWLLENLLIDGTLAARQVAALWLALFVALTIGRAVARGVAGRLAAPERCAVVGERAALDQIERKLAGNCRANVELVAWIPLGEGARANSAPTPEAFADRMRSADVHRVIVAPGQAESDELLDAVRMAKAAGLKVSILPRIFEVARSAGGGNPRYTAATWRKSACGIASHLPPRPRAGARAPRAGRSRNAPGARSASGGRRWSASPPRSPHGRVRTRPSGRSPVSGSGSRQRATRLDNRAYLGELEALVARLGLEGAVHFIGQREDMPAVMAALDVLLVPSTEEPFGLVVVEAMAAGTPVVATDTGGPAEIIADGVDGRLAPPRDVDAWAAAAVGLLTDRRTRERIVAAGRRTARRFSADRYAEEILTAYRDAMGATGL